MAKLIKISAGVNQAIESYAQALNYYPISSERLKTKISNLLRFVNSLGENPYAYPVCRYKNLGQQFDTHKRPLNPNLHQTVYKDESKRPWTFVYLINSKKNRITIVQMMYSSFIKEEGDHPTLLQRVVEKVFKDYGLS